MVIALKQSDGKERHFLSFSGKLFLSVISLFLFFAVCFLAYQYQREKEYKVELLNMQLQDYNALLHQELKDIPPGERRKWLDDYAQLHSEQGLRITIINLTGTVSYESEKLVRENLTNHLQRPEIIQAMAEGRGYDMRRTSKTTGVSYFYSATLFQPDGYIIRTALPYNLNLTNYLAVDSHYIWFTAVVTLLLQIYKRLRETKEALYSEREKLIMHLQTSREGLGVFTQEKKEILVNNLFTQYGNLISDQNLQATEDIFNVPEFRSITEFINKAQKRSNERGEKRMSLSINKNGRSFVIECIVFQDSCFEISINDITQEEEQSRLKRQLTQNIAHELKTPVSSIQGYLETIVNNENIPREKLQLFLERCYAQSNRLTRLLRDISVLTRMDEAAQMIDMEMVDVSLLVSNIINEVALDLEQRHITVVNSLRPKIQLKGNYSLLYSIFRNLTDNAIAYAGTNIHINISCFREDENFFYFSFADTGVGVPPEHLNRLFERFYRVDKGRSRKLGGTGLGLAIVKNAVLIHGGTISAKNNQGGGLEFVFTLAKGK